MILGGLFIALIAFNMAFDSVTSQFYVDIEHSMPRIGKRYQENENSLKELLSNKNHNANHNNNNNNNKNSFIDKEQQQLGEKLSKMSNEDVDKYLINAIRLIRILRKKYENFD